jgi:HlyD family secretion protein
MDVPRKSARRNRIIRRIVLGVVGVAGVTVISIVLGRLKPAAPTVERSTVWIDTVKRGPMLRDVRGLGTLVPEETLLIPANTDGRIERIFIEPGTPVKADSVILQLTNPELETEMQAAQFEWKAAEADYIDAKVTLEKQLLDLKSTAAQVNADYNTAKMEADRDQALAKEGLKSEIDSRISKVKAEQLFNRTQIEEKRLSINAEAVEAQLSSKKVAVEQAQAQYQLKKNQVEMLRVRAGTTGTLQALATPVEVGQKVSAGTPLGKVAQPWKLKAVLRIAETQAKDILIGQNATIDTRNGFVQGKVSRIDPSILNGTIAVDCKLEQPLPQGARPDLSVDGTVELERLNDVVYVGRPVFGQQESTVTLFKLDPDNRGATHVQVKLGRSSVNTIEIREGLRVGDQVVLSDMSAYDAQDRIRLN